MTEEELKLVLEQVPSEDQIYDHLLSVLNRVRKEQEAQQEPVGTFAEVAGTMNTLRVGTVAQQQMYAETKAKQLYTSQPVHCKPLTNEWCDHSWSYEGHSHNDRLYVCTHCKKEEWR